MKSLNSRTEQAINTFLNDIKDEINAQFENFGAPSSEEGFFSSCGNLLSNVELSIPAALGGRIKFTTSRNLN